MDDKLKHIAEGGDFDVVDAVRLLARRALGAAQGIAADAAALGMDGKSTKAVKAAKPAAGGPGVGPAAGATMEGETPQTAEGGLAQVLNSRMAWVLMRGGLETVEAVRAASDADLLAIDGINIKALGAIREKVGR